LPSCFSDFMRPACSVMGCAIRNWQAKKEITNTRTEILFWWCNHWENLFL
jgi:hypothetical protein